MPTAQRTQQVVPARAVYVHPASLTHRQRVLQVLYAVLESAGLPLNPSDTMTTISTLKAWMRQATSHEQKLLADRVGTSQQYLNHIAASEEAAYKREPKPALAAAIERETKVMAKASKGRLPIVYRTDLNSTCRGCDFARRCLGDDVVVRSEFPVIDSRQGALDLGGER
jgi:hypothetical protein